MKESNVSELTSFEEITPVAPITEEPTLSTSPTTMSSENSSLEHEPILLPEPIASLFKQGIEINNKAQAMLAGWMLGTPKVSPLKNYKLNDEGTSIVELTYEELKSLSN